MRLRALVVAARTAELPAATTVTSTEIASKGRKKSPAHPENAPPLRRGGVPHSAGGVPHSSGGVLAESYFFGIFSGGVVAF